MKRTNDAPATPPIPLELAGEIAAYLLMQRLAGSPHKARAFTAWEIKVQRELDELNSRARHAIGRDKPEAAAVAAGGQ